MKCDECEATCKDHQWGRKRAQTEGWFFTHDGKAFCPKHNPPWVAEWRARKAQDPDRPATIGAGLLIIADVFDGIDDKDGVPDTPERRSVQADLRAWAERTKDMPADA